MRGKPEEKEICAAYRQTGREEKKMEDNRTLVQRTADQLVDYIVEQRLTEGDRLPSESELMKYLDVSRTTTREAVRMLSSRNILEVRHGSGIYVSKNTGISEDPLGLFFIRDKERLVEDLMEFRLLVEPRIAARAAQRADQEQAKKLEELADEVERLYRSGQPHNKADNAFHAKLGELSGNLVFPHLIPIISKAIDMFIDMTSNELMNETLESHRAIVEAVKARDGVGAEDAMTLHLVYNRNRIREKRKSREPIDK